MREGGGIAGEAESGRGGLGMEHVRGMLGRWPDADAVLQGSMSEGLRDWDLWYVASRSQLVEWQELPKRTGTWW